jgi:hypothetical protein
MDSCLGWLPLLADTSVAYIFLIAAILVATLTMFLRLYRYQSRQRHAGDVRPSDRQHEPDPRGFRADAPESIIRWEVQMQELARDLKAEIDSKMVALEHLIRDADRAAERLEKARATTDAHAPLADQAADNVSPTEWTDTENGRLRDEAYMLADYGFSAADIASRLNTPLGQIELILRLREEKT